MPPTKTSINAVLSTISQPLARVGLDPRASIYIADSALVTEPNLTTMGDTTRFITRLPASFAEHERVIREAVRRTSGSTMGGWPSAAPRPNDRERTPVATKPPSLSTLRTLGRWSCTPAPTIGGGKNASSAAWPRNARAGRNGSDRRRNRSTSAAPTPRRPPAGQRTPHHPRNALGLVATLHERDEAIVQDKEEAGCFVLIPNVPHEGPPGSPVPYDGKTLLEAYEDQHGIERNFGFRKAPVIVNRLFLKRPERIEALGLILLIALLLWRLMERDDASPRGRDPMPAGGMGRRFRRAPHCIHDDHQI